MCLFGIVFPSPFKEQSLIKMCILENGFVCVLSWLFVLKIVLSLQSCVMPRTTEHAVLTIVVLCSRNIFCVCLN